MDLYVHYWDPIENRVNVIYYDFTSIGQGTHTDLSITNDLPSNKFHQVSMDRPNINLKFLQRIFETL